MTTMTGLINLDQVVAHCRAELPDVDCYVEQTGGGCATIYLGTAYFLDQDDDVLPVDTTYESGLIREICIPVSGGPGHFEGSGWTHGRAYAEEFSIGYDCCDSLYVDGTYIDGWDMDGADERVIARRMCQLYRDHQRVVAGTVR